MAREFLYANGMRHLDGLFLIFVPTLVVRLLAWNVVILMLRNGPKNYSLFLVTIGNSLLMKKPIVNSL